MFNCVLSIIATGTAKSRSGRAMREPVTTIASAASSAGASFYANDGVEINARPSARGAAAYFRLLIRVFFTV